MKKKRYITPTLKVITIDTCRFLCGSGVYLAEDNPSNPAPAIPYAGVDENGEMEPGARMDRFMDDEEEEE
jgi:hypothetical protein